MKLQQKIEFLRDNANNSKVSAELKASINTYSDLYTKYENLDSLDVFESTNGVALGQLYDAIHSLTASAPKAAPNRLRDSARKGKDGKFEISKGGKFETKDFLGKAKSAQAKAKAKREQDAKKAEAKREADAKKAQAKAPRPAPAPKAPKAPKGKPEAKILEATVDKGDILRDKQLNKDILVGKVDGNAISGTVVKKVGQGSKKKGGKAKSKPATASATPHAHAPAEHKATATPVKAKGKGKGKSKPAMASATPHAHAPAEHKSDEKAKAATKAKEAKAAEKAKEAKAKANPFKKGVYIGDGKGDVIRIESAVKQADGEFKIKGFNRYDRPITVERKASNFEAKTVEDFRNTEDDFNGKEVAEMPEEISIMKSFLNLHNNSDKKKLSNYKIVLDKYVTQEQAEAKAKAKGKKAEFSPEFKMVYGRMYDYFEGKSENIKMSESDYLTIVEKVHSVRVYPTVSALRTFASWRGKDKTAEDAKNLLARMRKLRKQKSVSASDPLFKEFVQAEEILDKYKSGADFKFPVEGLGSGETGLLGMKHYVNAFHKTHAKKKKKTAKRKSSATKNAPVPAKKKFLGIF